MEQDSKKQLNGLSIALLAITFVQLASSATSPALASIRAAHPEVSPFWISALSTLPNLIGVPVTILCGMLLGRKLSYRLVTIVGLIAAFVAGVGPFFTESYYLLLVWRGLFGMGHGMLTPVVMPTMMAFFDKDGVTRQASRNAISTNIGAVFFQMVGGALCTNLGWRYTFLIYFMFVPVVFIAFRYMPEPKIETRTAGGESRKITLPMLLPILKWCILYGFHMLFFYVSVTETSGIVRSSGFGSATTAATVLSLTTGAGVIGGMLYKRFAFLKERSLAGAFIALGVGYLTMALSTNIALLCLGSVIVGIGFGLNMPAFQVLVGYEVPDYARSTAASILAVFGSFAGFFSKSVIDGVVKAFGFESGRPSYIVCTVGYLVLAVIVFVAGVIARRRKRTA